LSVLNEQGQSIQIPVGSQDVTIQPNGTITATLPGQKFETPVTRLKLVNPDTRNLTREADGLFSAQEDLASLDDIRLVPGSIEGSNVSAAQAMVQMIAQNRLFDLNIRLVQVAEQNSKTAGTLMSLSRA
jgi:flagellar basal-body rod protein FlgF